MVEVLVEEETILVVSGLLVKKMMTPPGLAILDEEEEMAFWLQLGALGFFSLDLAGLGGIGTCLGASCLCRFTSLLLQQPRFHE